MLFFIGCMSNRPSGVKQENSDGSAPAAPMFAPKVVARRRPAGNTAPAIDVVNGPVVPQARSRPEREKKESQVVPVKVSLQASMRRAGSRVSMTTAESLMMQGSNYSMDPSATDADPTFPPSQLPFPVSNTNLPWMDHYTGDVKIDLPAYKDASLPKVIEATKYQTLEEMEPILAFQSAKEVLMHESILQPVKMEDGELAMPPPQFAFLQLPSHLPIVIDTQLKPTNTPTPQNSDFLKHDIPMTMDDILLRKNDQSDKSLITSQQYRIFSSNTENNINRLPEGQIGEMVVYKSGKVKLRIGDVLFDVNQGIHVPHHQQLVAMNTPSESEATCMVPIAEVRHQLVCSVDVKDVIKKKKAEDKRYISVASSK